MGAPVRATTEATIAAQTKPTKRTVADSLNDVKPLNVTPFPSRNAGFRDLVRLTEPSINITHNGSTKLKNSKEELEPAVIDYKDVAPLDNESKFYNSPQNNVEKDQSEGEEVDDDVDASQEKPNKEIEAHTVILTDNFFLPGPKLEEGEKSIESKDAEDGEEAEYEYEYEYVDDTEEPPVEAVTKSEVEPKEKIIQLTTVQPSTQTTKPSTTSTITTTESTTSETTTASTTSEEDDEIVEDEERSLPTTTKPEVTSIKTLANTTLDTPPLESDQEEEPGNTTESWVVVASVQTSRSVSGARFLPFPQVTQEEKKAPITELENLSKQSDEKTSKEQITSEQLPEIASDVEISTDTPQPELPPAESAEQSVAETEKPESQVTEAIELVSGSLPPVVIRKYSPRTTTPKPPRVPKTTTTTTAAPSTSASPDSDLTKKNSKLFIQDDLSGLLPADFKPRYTGYKKKTTPTTTTEPTISSSSSTASTTPATTEEGSSVKFRNINNTRSFFKNDATAQDIAPPSDIKSKIKFVADDLSKFLPKDYTTEKPKFAVVDDVSKFLPPGYKPPASEKKNASPATSPPLPVIPLSDDISKFLPPDYKAPAVDEIQSTTLKIATTLDDISKFLPPGYKLKPEKTTTAAPSINAESKEEKKVDDDLLGSILKKVNFKEVSDLVPADYKPSTEEPENYPSTTSKGVVFPTRPGGGKKETGSLSYKRPKGPPPPKIEVRKGPPTR